MPKGKKKSCKALKTSEEGGLSGFMKSVTQKVQPIKKHLTIQQCIQSV